MYTVIKVGGDLDFLGVWHPVVGFVKQWDGVIVPLLGIGWLWWIGRDKSISPIEKRRTANEEINGLKRRVKDLKDECVEHRRKIESLTKELKGKDRSIGQLSLRTLGGKWESHNSTVVVRYTESKDQGLATRIMSIFEQCGWKTGRQDARGGDLENPSPHARIVLEAQGDMAYDVTRALEQHDLGEHIVHLRRSESDLEADVLITIYHAPDPLR